MRARRVLDRKEINEATMELNLLLTLDLREQAALQAALVTHGAPMRWLRLRSRALVASDRWKRHDNCASGWLKRARQVKQTLPSLHVIEKSDD